MIGSVFLNFGAVDAVITDNAESCGTIQSEYLSPEECETWSDAGAVIGGVVAIVGWFVWLPGTVIIGLAALFTRGKSVTYDVDA